MNSNVKQGFPLRPLCIMVLAMITACSTGQTERSYRYSFSREFTAGNASLSDESIDGEKTFEIRFKLKKTTDCVKIQIQSSYMTDSLPPKKMPAKTFFIAEKSMDLSQFKDGPKFTYTVMGKNYTTQWEQQPSLTVCSDEQDPFTVLDDKSLYRVRFTSLMDLDFTFTVAIQADTEILPE